MAYPPIAPALQKLVTERAHSIEQLELLLFLRAQVGQTYSEEQLARQVGMARDLVTSSLEQLVTSGMILSVGGSPKRWSYDPTSQLAPLVDELALAYTSQRVEFIVLISTNAMERVRNAGLRAFAQAFLVKGTKKDG